MKTEPGLHPLLVLILAPFAGRWSPCPGAFDLWPAGIISCALYAYLLCTCSVRRVSGAAGCSASACSAPGVLGLRQHPRLRRCRPGWPAFHHHLLRRTRRAVPGILRLVLRALRTRPPGGMLMGFPVTWVLSEWLRSWLFTGFPWLYLGYAHLDTPIAGWAPIVGVYGLSSSAP